MWLGDNSLCGSFSISFANLTKLSYISLRSNNFTSTLPSDMYGFHKLEHFDVSNNSFLGPFPKSLFLNPSLQYVYLEGNQFTGPVDFANTSMLHSIDMAGNRFDGPIPESISKFLNLQMLRLQHNNFTGQIPRSESKLVLQDLDLSNNMLEGEVPACLWRSFDISRNQLEGKLPESLIKCQTLQLVNVENNRFKDTFPSWLGSLPSLYVLILRSSEFYGSLFNRHVTVGFQSIRIIDISHNDFTGVLPPYCFSNWREMMTTTEIEEYSEYMEGVVNFTEYRNTMEMVNKGVETSFERIRKDFRAIDFSGNKIYWPFEGIASSQPFR